MSHPLKAVYDLRDQLLRKGCVYQCTFEDFTSGASGHPVDCQVYPDFIKAIGGLDKSWHLKFCYPSSASQHANRIIHGLLLAPIKDVSDPRDIRNYDKYYPKARYACIAAGGPSYSNQYAQYHAFSRNVGICVIHGKYMGDLLIDTFIVKEEPYVQVNT